eukprot:185873-Chlamydomonas_euryale.AAC.5
MLVQVVPVHSKVFSPSWMDGWIDGWASVGFRCVFYIACSSAAASQWIRRGHSAHTAPEGLQHWKRKGKGWEEGQDTGRPWTWRAEDNKGGKGGWEKGRRTKGGRGETKKERRTRRIGGRMLEQEGGS